MNKIFSEDYYVDRLKKEYEEYGNLIIAIDFDGTIFDLYKDGIDVTPVINLVKRCMKAKLTLCLWTACTDQWSLIYKKALVDHMELKFDYYNESPAINHSRKPHFSILLDDRAGLTSAFCILERVLNELNLG